MKTTSRPGQHFRPGFAGIPRALGLCVDSASDSDMMPPVRCDQDGYRCDMKRFASEQLHATFATFESAYPAELLLSGSHRNIVQRQNSNQIVRPVENQKTAHVFLFHHEASVFDILVLR